MALMNRDGENIPQMQAWSFRWTWTRPHCVRFLRPWCTFYATCPWTTAMGMTMRTGVMVSPVLFHTNLSGCQSVCAAVLFFLSMCLCSSVCFSLSLLPCLSPSICLIACLSLKSFCLSLPRTINYLFACVLPQFDLVQNNCACDLCWGDPLQLTGC